MNVSAVIDPPLVIKGAARFAMANRENTDTSIVVRKSSRETSLILLPAHSKSHITTMHCSTALTSLLREAAERYKEMQQIPACTRGY